MSENTSLPESRIKAYKSIPNRVSELVDKAKQARTHADEVKDKAGQITTMVRQKVRGI